MTRPDGAEQACYARGGGEVGIREMGYVRGDEIGMSNSPEAECVHK